jgi:hypothetical protein
MLFHLLIRVKKNERPALAVGIATTIVNLP